MIKIVCRVRICIHANRSRQQTQPYFPLSLLISTEFELESRLSRTTCLSRSHGHGKFKRKPRKLINNTGLLCIRTYDNFLSTKLQKKTSSIFLHAPSKGSKCKESSGRLSRISQPIFFKKKFILNIKFWVLCLHAHDLAWWPAFKCKTLPS